MKTIKKLKLNAKKLENKEMRTIRGGAVSGWCEVPYFGTAYIGCKTDADCIYFYGKDATCV